MLHCDWVTPVKIFSRFSDFKISIPKSEECIIKARFIPLTKYYKLQPKIPLNLVIYYILAMHLPRLFILHISLLLYECHCSFWKRQSLFSPKHRRAELDRRHSIQIVRSSPKSRIINRSIISPIPCLLLKYRYYAKIYFEY